MLILVFAPSEIMRRVKGRTCSQKFEEFPLVKKGIGDDILGCEDTSTEQLVNLLKR